jgi:hypothetical protein
MRNRLVVAFVVALTLPTPAQQLDSVQSFLEILNRALRADAAALAPLFTDDSECRFGNNAVAAGPKAIAEALVPPAFSEQTRPRLENPTVFPFSSEFTLISARLVSYGTLILRQDRHVLLLLRETRAGWRIVSWSMPDAPLFALPAGRFPAR